MKSKNKVVLLLALLIAFTGLIGGLWYFNENYIILSGVQSRDTTELDLSGHTGLKIEKLTELQSLEKLDLRDTGITNEEFRQLQEALPNCDIRWSVPVQGGYQDSESQSLVMDNITETEIAQLAYFPHLQAVDAAGCKDLPMIMTLTEAYPNLDVSYVVPVGDMVHPHDTTNIMAVDVDAAQLDLALNYLPAVDQVEIQGVLPEAAALQSLTGNHPQVEFFWQYDLLGTKADSETKELTLTDVPTERIPELMEGIYYLPSLERVNLKGNLAEGAALRELSAAHPQVKFHWQIELFGVPADVDTVELDLSEIPMDSVETVENALVYLPSLKKVIMSHCGISNEDMDALDKRTPDVRFVWTVRVGAFYLRTDETAFMPGKYRMLPEGNQCYNLRYCVDMECLDLGHCRINDCEFVAFMPNLKYLLLPLTNISDISPLANHDKLVYLELFTCRKLKDYTPLLTLTNLEDLNICYTYGDIEIIAQMTWLKNLWWSAGKKNVAITKERMEILSKALPNTYLELDTQSSTAEGWRKLQHYYEQRDIFGMPYFTA